MQILLTEASGPISLEVGIILAVRHPPAQNGGLIMETHILTTMMGPQGNLAFSVKESVEEVARRINYARTIEQGKEFDASLLGFPSH